MSRSRSRDLDLFAGDGEVARGTHLVGVEHRLEGDGVVVDAQRAELLLLAQRDLGDSDAVGLAQGAP